MAVPFSPESPPWLKAPFPTIHVEWEWFGRCHFQELSLVSLPYLWLSPVAVRCLQERFVSQLTSRTDHCDPVQWAFQGDSVVGKELTAQA